MGELERLIKEGNYFNDHDAIKLLAERVKGLEYKQENVNKMQAANNREAYNRVFSLEERIAKLESQVVSKEADNIQATNPLKKNQIELLMLVLDVNEKYICNQEELRKTKLLLESYLGK